jgi:hypothetical protein
MVAEELASFSNPSVAQGNSQPMTSSVTQLYEKIS